MSELVAETTPAPADAPTPAPAAGVDGSEAPKRRSSSCAALMGASADEVKKLSLGFGVVGEFAV